MALYTIIDSRSINFTSTLLCILKCFTSICNTGKLTTYSNVNVKGMVPLWMCTACPSGTSFSLINTYLPHMQHIPSKIPTHVYRDIKEGACNFTTFVTCCSCCCCCNRCGTRSSCFPVRSITSIDGSMTTSIFGFLVVDDRTPFAVPRSRVVDTIFRQVLDGCALRMTLDFSRVLHEVGSELSTVTSVKFLVLLLVVFIEKEAVPQ